jgi:hypothetical protein
MNRCLEQAPNSLIVSNQSQPHRQQSRNNEGRLNINELGGKALKSRLCRLSVQNETRAFCTENEQNERKSLEKV